MKYKVCKLVDGRGIEWYQIKEKKYFFWRWYRTIVSTWADSYSKIATFNTEQDAINHIQKMKNTEEYLRKIKNVKVVECKEA